MIVPAKRSSNPCSARIERYSQKEAWMSYFIWNHYNIVHLLMNTALSTNFCRWKDKQSTNKHYALLDFYFTQIPKQPSNLLWSDDCFSAWFFIKYKSFFCFHLTDLSTTCCGINQHDCQRQLSSVSRWNQLPWIKKGRSNSVPPCSWFISNSLPRVPFFTSIWEMQYIIKWIIGAMADF